MGKNHFTMAQQELLRSNPYIQAVSETTITYTRDFKERFSLEYQTGKLPSQILDDMGIDHKIIGKRRKDSIVKRLREYAQRPDGFNDARSQNFKRLSTKELPESEQIKRLEQKIAYLQQENEFLKKNIQLSRLTKMVYNLNHKKNTTLSKE